MLIYFLTPIYIIDEEEIKLLKEGSEEEDIRGGKPEFLQFTSEWKNFLHGFVEKKLSTAMTKKFGNCTSRRSFLREAKSEQNRIFKNCCQWIGEDVNFYVLHLLELLTYEKVRKHDHIFDFGRKTYIPSKISLGSVASAVEYFIFTEAFVRYISKILRINYKEALEKVYGDI